MLTIVERLLAGEAVPANGPALAAKMRNAFQRAPQDLPTQAKAFALGIGTGADLDRKKRLERFELLVRELFAIEDATYSDDEDARIERNLAALRELAGLPRRVAS